MTPQTPTPFVPEFEQGVFILNLITGRRTPVNSTYFATERTAHFIAEKYGDGVTYEGDFFPGGGGQYFCSALVRAIRHTPEHRNSGDAPESVMVNAGILAGYYERNPEAEFPGLAEKLIRAQLKSGV